MSHIDPALDAVIRSFEEMFPDRVRGYYRPSPVHYPIGFPDPDAEFFGYTERQVTTAEGANVPSTRDLVRVTGWLATALNAHEEKEYVARKRDCHELYRECFHDEWGSLLQKIYNECRTRWGYRLPADRDDREHLRAICTRVLAFENHFLTRFKPFLLEESRRIRSGDANRARWLMQEIPFERRTPCTTRPRSSSPRPTRSPAC